MPVYGFPDRRSYDNVSKAAQRVNNRLGKRVGAMRVKEPPAKRTLLGKPNSDVAQGATGTFTIYSGDTKGSETATSREEDAYCRAAAITTTQMSYLEWVDGGWEAVPAECPE